MQRSRQDVAAGPVAVNSDLWWSTHWIRLLLTQTCEGLIYSFKGEGMGNLDLFDTRMRSGIVWFPTTCWTLALICWATYHKWQGFPDISQRFQGEPMTTVLENPPNECTWIRLFHHYWYLWVASRKLGTINLGSLNSSSSPLKPSEVLGPSCLNFRNSCLDWKEKPWDFARDFSRNQWRT